jgi:hypothetical protein
MNLLIAGLIALGLVLGTTTHASAGPLIAAGLMFLIPTLGATAAAVLGSVLALTIGLGMSYLAQKLLSKRPEQNVGGTTGRLQTGGVVSRSFPFGEKAIVSQSVPYANSFGQDGKTPNAYYVMDLALADLPVGGGNDCLAELWVNGSKVTWNPAGTPGPDGIAIPEFNKDGKDHLWVRVYDGTQTTADARLVELFGGDPDRPYDAGRVGTGMVKAVVTFRLNREVFGGVPSFKFVVRGVPLYDLREDDTAGGDGDQRWNSPEKWNLAPGNNGVVLYNVLRGIRYDGKWFFGGQTVSGQQIPASAWAAAMNEADIPTEKADGQFEPQFACSGEIRLDMEPAQVVKDLLMGCNGRLAEVGGVYKPHFGAAGSAVMSITDDDILITEGQTYEPFKSMAEQVNAVTAKYIEPGEGWTAKDAPALYDADLESEDGGRRQSVDVAYDYVVSGTQVQRLMASALAEARRERRHSIQLPPDAYPLEPNDFIVWSSERNGYVNKLFRIDAVQDLANGNVALNLTEVDPSDYDWDADTDEQPIVISPTPIVFPPSQGIAGADIEGVTVQGQGSRAKAGARLLWNGTDQDDVRAVAFQIRLNGETDLVYEGETTEASVAEGEYIVTANLLGATAYEGRLKFVPFSGRATVWSDWIDFTTPDVRVSYEEFDRRFRQANELTAGFIRDLNARLDNLGGAVASIESHTTTADLDQVERARRISASLGAAKASVKVVEQAVATLDLAFALFQVETEASIDAISAEGLLEFQQVVSPPTGAVSGARMLVKATDSGLFAEAGLEAYALAGMGGSPSGRVVLVGEKVFARDGIGGDPFPILDVSGRMLYTGLMPGSTVRVVNYPRDRIATGNVAVGSGNTAGGAGQNSLREVLMGSIDLPANTEAISGGTGNKVPVEVNARIDTDGQFGPYASTSSATFPYIQWRVIARPTGGGSDVVLIDDVMGATAATFGSSTTTAWYHHGQTIGTVFYPKWEKSNDAVIDAGNYDIYVQWRVGGWVGFVITGQPDTLISGFKWGGNVNVKGYIR